MELTLLLRMLFWTFGMAWPFVLSSRFEQYWAFCFSTNVFCVCVLINFVSSCLWVFLETQTEMDERDWNTSKGLWGWNLFHGTGLIRWKTFVCKSFHKYAMDLAFWSTEVFCAFQFSMLPFRQPRQWNIDWTRDEKKMGFFQFGCSWSFPMMLST